jgi:hypothetical protein
MDSLLPKSKICSKCGEEKLLEEFNKQAKEKYGKAYQCKLCCKQYREANKEKIKNNTTKNIKEKRYYEIINNLIPESMACTKCGEEKLLGEFHRKSTGKYGKRATCKLCRKQYREANKEKIKEYQKQFREENKEKLTEYMKQYRQDNKERTNERARNRRKNDEQYRIRCCLSSSLWSALNDAGKTKNASILTYIGCSIEFMQEHLNSTKKPDWGDDLHIDHIIPCASFDHTNEEEVKKCWNWRNLRYLPAEENISKGDTLDMDLVKSYGIEDLLPLEQKLRDGN